MTSSVRFGMLCAMRLRLEGSALAAVLWCAGCTGGTETGNPPFTGALSYTGHSSSADIGVGPGGGDLARVERAWLDVSGVQVSTSGDCVTDSSQAFTVPALGVGDHAAGRHNFTVFEARPAAFCSVELRFLRAPSAEGVPAEVAGRSVSLQGELADGTSFTIESVAEPVFRLQAGPGGFVLGPQQNSMLLAFDFAAWLQGLDLEHASRVDGQVRVDAQTNPELLQAFESNLAAGVALYRDPEQNGVLEADADLCAR